MIVIIVAAVALRPVRTGAGQRVTASFLLAVQEISVGRLDESSVDKS